MEQLSLEASYNTPSVYFNHEIGHLEIAGRSIPEHGNLFFRPLIDWIKEYVATNPPKTTFDVKIDYLNSSSAKLLLEIFEKLEPLQSNNKEVVINWHYEEDDEEMRESGQEYNDAVSIPFKIIAVEEF